MIVTELPPDCLSIKQHIRLLIHKAYVKHNGNRERMARDLCIDPETLRYRMGDYPPSKRGRPRKSN